MNGIASSKGATRLVLARSGQCAGICTLIWGRDGIKLCQYTLRIVIWMVQYSLRELIYAKSCSSSELLTTLAWAVPSGPQLRVTPGR
jgi:hypothetical protein